jgi:Uma2 family endonuclease
MVAPPKPRMTAREFFQLPETDQRLELINGEIIEMGTPIPSHQDSVLNTALLIKQLTQTLGGKVYIAPLEVYLDEDNIPQPDVMWVAPDSRCVIGEKRLQGAPDLVVEVFSPSTQQRDKDDKFKLYQRHGVREYWMLDPVQQFVEVWQLVDGRFALNGVFIAGQTFTSAVLNDQTVEVKALFGV